MQKTFETFSCSHVTTTKLFRSVLDGGGLETFSALVQLKSLGLDKKPRILGGTISENLIFLLGPKPWLTRDRQSREKEKFHASFNFFVKPTDFQKLSPKTQFGNVSIMQNFEKFPYSKNKVKI